MNLICKFGLVCNVWVTGIQSQIVSPKAVYCSTTACYYHILLQTKEHWTSYVNLDWLLINVWVTGIQYQIAPQKQDIVISQKAVYFCVRACYYNIVLQINQHWTLPSLITIQRDFSCTQPRSRNLCPELKSLLQYCNPTSKSTITNNKSSVKLLTALVPLWFQGFGSLVPLCFV